MHTTHIVFLVEEPSMEAFLNAWLPRHLAATFEIRAFQGKPDLLAKLQDRVEGFLAWMPADWRIVVIVDRDDDDCRALKALLDDICARAGAGVRKGAGGAWNCAACLAIEELEAWYFGAWDAVTAAFPRANRRIPQAAKYRDSDRIAGGTWEAFERVMQQSGYFKGGLQKTLAAREIGARFQADRCGSTSFGHLLRVLAEVGP